MSERKVEGKQAIIILTHDVDSVRRPLRHVLQRRSRFKLKDLLKHLLGLDNLYNNILRVVEFEESLGVKSTFFVPVQLFPLEEVESDLRDIARRGWEIELHYVFEPIQPESLFRLQREYLEEALNIKVRGVRVHNLQISDKLLDLFSEEGLIYDSSLRCEQVRRLTPFRIREKLIEIPIGVMDADLFGRLHMSERRAYRYVMQKIEKAIAAGEKVFTLLFHQESFRMIGGRIYRDILEELHKREYIMCTCLEALKMLGLLSSTS